MKVNIIGAGLSGIVAAIIFRKLGHKVELFEQRDHIGGNCFDSDRGGVLFHHYGPHVFHTHEDNLIEFLSRYTAFRPFELRLKADTALGRISTPYSQKTVSEVGRELSDEEIKQYIFKDYCEKQWGVPFTQIPQAILNRVKKTKDEIDPTWFHGIKHQCLPVNGYTAMMQAMLEGFKVNLSVKNDEWRRLPADLTVYTGPVDQFFGCCYGPLPYRSLKFQTKKFGAPLEHFLVTDNTPDKPHTRTYDHSYFREKHSGPTYVTKEIPFQCKEGDEPFYPMPFGKGQDLYDSRYAPMAKGETNVLFLGRLATYKYLDMDVAIKQVFVKTKTNLSEFA